MLAEENKKERKDRFFLEQEKSRLSFVWIVFFARVAYRHHAQDIFEGP